MRNMEYGKKHWKTYKIRNTHCRMWNMVRNTQKSEKWEINAVGPGYDKKIEKKRGKWETNTVASGIWRRRLKNVENEECIL